MPISLRQLEIFKKVAETGHVTQAGEMLFISQSAVSMAIAELENELGGPLFERKGRRLLINERGRILLPKVKQITNQIDSVIKMMKETNEDPVGLLKIGASTTIGNYLVPGIIGDFSKRYSRVEVSLYIGNTQQVEQEVLNGELDLGLIEGPLHSPSLESLRWRDDELVVIAGKAHPWNYTSQVDAEMLASAQWIVRESGSGTREIFESAMAKQVEKYNISLELGHTEAIKKAVEAGLGVGCLSRLAVTREIENGWLYEVKTSLNLKRQLTILLHPNKYRTNILNRFIESL